MNFFEKIKQGLIKTKNSMLGRIKGVLNSFTKIDEDLFEELEETMIMSDMGVETSTRICDELRKKIKERGITDPSLIMELIQEIIAEMMGDDTELNLSTTPSVILVIGVNGAGKTTTIGKLCYQLRNEGKKVIVAAADTFRAAAVEQLDIWCQRAGVDIVKHSEGSDPASVVFDAVTAAKARNCDVVVCDTAGRLHNKKNLMDELAKINRVIDKQAEGCAKEVLLVLDATTGQNAVNQARLFKEAAGITGIVLTKLDGTAKGGIVISIKNELNIPVKLIGLGEKIDDLQSFNSRDFVRALFDDDSEPKIKESDYERLEGNEDVEYTEENTETPQEDNSEEITFNVVSDVTSLGTDTVSDDEAEEQVEEDAETEVFRTQVLGDDEESEKADDTIVTLGDKSNIDSGTIWNVVTDEDNQTVEENTEEVSEAEEQENEENTEEEIQPKKKKFSFGNLFKRKDKKKK